LVIAVEPMINAGTYDVQMLPDGWTVKTADRRLSAHYENTVALTEEGVINLTEVEIGE
jgi:methionyl aminopeptidase